MSSSSWLDAPSLASLSSESARVRLPAALPCSRHSQAETDDRHALAMQKTQSCYSARFFGWTHRIGMAIRSGLRFFYFTRFGAQSCLTGIWNTAQIIVSTMLGIPALYCNDLKTVVEQAYSPWAFLPASMTLCGMGRRLSSGLSSFLPIHQASEKTTCVCSARFRHG